VSEPAYLYDHDSALERLRALENIEDPDTLATLNFLGDLSGLRCLEVGGGAGSIARWLAGRVGPSGRVLATDTDPRFLQDSAGRTLEARAHDIGWNPLPSHAFDLIHVRHVLIHLGDRLTNALDTLCAAVRPGGNLVIEESDFEGAGAAGGTVPGLAVAYDAGLKAILELYRQRGMDVHLGARLAAELQHRGLTIRGTSQRSRLVRGGSPEALFHQHSYRQVRAALLEQQIASAATIDALIAGHANADLRYRSRQTVTVIANMTP